MSEIQKEIIEALQMSPEDLPEAKTLDPADSPLNYPVKEKDIAGGGTFSEEFPTPDDAPEQQIGDQGGGPDLEVPSEQALAFADFILESANNVISVGAGFFIKIRKDESFYEYEELIQVIDDQNSQNVKRLLLDEMDKAMLKPLLALVLRKRAKVMTPEQQLLIALVSILIKKAQVVMEIRAENQILTERIKGIIEKEHGRSGEVKESRVEEEMESEERSFVNQSQTEENGESANGLQSSGNGPSFSPEAKFSPPLAHIVEVAEPESPPLGKESHSIEKHREADT